MVSFQASKDRRVIGALEPIFETGSDQAEIENWWLCQGSAKTPLS